MLVGRSISYDSIFFSLLVAALFNNIVFVFLLQDIKGIRRRRSMKTIKTMVKDM